MEKNAGLAYFWEKNPGFYFIFPVRFGGIWNMVLVFRGYAIIIFDSSGNCGVI